jgi:hypothetical protein
MVNTAKKGYTKEKRARDELTKDGYLIAFKSIRWRFGCIDFAKLFDVVAIGKDVRGDLIWRFISCKHFGNSNNYLPHQEEIRNFKQQYSIGPEHMSFEVWIWHKPKWEGRGSNKKWVEGHWDIQFII